MIVVSSCRKVLVLALVQKHVCTTDQISSRNVSLSDAKQEASLKWPLCDASLRRTKFHCPNAVCATPPARCARFWRQTKNVLPFIFPTLRDVGAPLLHKTVLLDVGAPSSRKTALCDRGGVAQSCFVIYLSHI